MENYGSKKIALTETALPQEAEQIFEKIVNLRELLMTYNSAIREVTTKLEILNDGSGVITTFFPLHKLPDLSSLPVL